jgi:hypothetical protein
MKRQRKSSVSKDVRTKADPEKAKRYEAIKGSARQYRDTKTGAIISRNQRDKAVLPSRAGGQISKEKLAKTLRAKGVVSHIARPQTLWKERQELLKKAGVKVSLKEVRESKEMKDILRGLRSKDNSARGAKARALVQLGLRDESWTWAVGETPRT